MSKQQILELASIVGATLATASDESARSAIYNALYVPVVKMLKKDDTFFPRMRFFLPCLYR